jgi:hypothetical protein
MLFLAGEPPVNARLDALGQVGDKYDVAKDRDLRRLRRRHFLVPGK